MKIKLLTDINVSGKFKNKGSIVETTTNEANQLIQRGYAEASGGNKTPSKSDKWQTIAGKDEDGNDVIVDAMTIPKLKKYLEDNKIDYTSDLRSDDLKDLVEAHLSKE